MIIIQKIIRKNFVLDRINYDLILHLDKPIQYTKKKLLEIVSKHYNYSEINGKITTMKYCAMKKGCYISLNVYFYGDQLNVDTGN